MNNLEQVDLVSPWRVTRMHQDEDGRAVDRKGSKIWLMSQRFSLKRLDGIATHPFLSDGSHSPEGIITSYLHFKINALFFLLRHSENPNKSSQWESS